jgi:predicted RNase H-like HicB family nuclease
MAGRGAGAGPMVCMMRAYAFTVVVERDEDRWHAHCPALAEWAAATWGDTEEQAYQHIQEVVQMIVEGMVEDGVPVPVGRQ